MRVLENKNCVIALGGGSILSKSVRNLMKKNSLTIYLETDFNLLYKRVSFSRCRPLLVNQDIKVKLKQLIIGK